MPQKDDGRISVDEFYWLGQTELKIENYNNMVKGYDG